MPGFYASGEFLLGSSGSECLALGRDALQQFIPGLNERSRSLDLKSVAQILNMNAGLVELGQHLIPFSGTCRDAPVDVAMVGQGFQGFLWHGVHGEGCSQAWT